MKLINKLLPIFAIGTAATVVTPLTACTSGTSYNALEDVDTSDWEQYDKSEILIDDTVNEFASVVMEDPSVFEKDVIWGRNKICQSSTDNAYIVTTETKITHFNYTLSNLKLEKINGQYCWSYKSSLTFGLEIYTVTNAAPVEEDTKTTVSAKAEVDIKRMPITPTLVEYPGLVGPESRLYFQFVSFTDSSMAKQYFSLIPDAHHYSNLELEMEESNSETGELIQKVLTEYYILNDKDTVEYQWDGPVVGNGSYISPIDVIRWPSYYFSETTITNK